MHQSPYNFQLSVREDSASREYGTSQVALVLRSKRKIGVIVKSEVAVKRAVKGKLEIKNARGLAIWC